MKRNDHIRKFLAWALCLVMLASMLAMPVLAAEEDAPPAAPAEKVETPAEKEETPAEKEETPAEKVETPAEKVETPAEKVETPAEKVETPAEKEEVPAEKEETPAEKEETPAEKEETPAEKVETPAEKEEVPAEKEETPAEAPVKATKAPAKATQAPVEPDDAPDQADEAPADPGPVAADEPVVAASLFTLDEPTSDDGFVIDWDSEEIQNAGWAGQLGAVETSNGFYIYVATDVNNGAFAEIATPGQYYSPTVLRIDCEAAWGDPGVAKYNGAPIEGSDVVYYEKGGVRYSEIFIPKSVLPASDTGYIVRAGDASFDFAATALADEAEVEPVYNGIVIDGSFADWAAVPKTETDNAPHDSSIPHVDMNMAVVWDGDYVYIYLDYQDGNAGAVSAYGYRGNGQFAITTDLGRTMLIRPNIAQGNRYAVVDGVDGATIAVDNYNWSPVDGHKVELAIPASALPEYLESFSFGYYMAEPIITGIVNMQDAPGGVDPFQANVVIDGKYNDWVGYPHHLIEYDNPGIQHHNVDGEGALWCSGRTLYGHVDTQHPDHLAEQGSCYLAAISIAFNGDRSFKEYPTDGNFYPRILAINEDGTIIDYYKTLNEGNPLPQGTHTFYIFDIRTDPINQFGHTDEDGLWHDATAADLIENAFGIMKVTVTGTKDEVEFELDLERVADYIGQDANEAFKTIDIQWGRIGQQWITIAGTPTGPILGVALAVGAVGAPLCYSTFKKRKESQDEDEAE